MPLSCLKVCPCTHKMSWPYFSLGWEIYASGTTVVERKTLRRIYGPICEEVIWRSRYNEQVYCLYDENDLVTTIKITRLRWAGHTV